MSEVNGSVSPGYETNSHVEHGHSSSTSASPIAVPGPTEASERNSENGLKRKQSPEAEQEKKRRRLSVDDETSNPDAAKDTVHQSPSTPVDLAAEDSNTQDREARRKSARDEERKRGKRLFGGLLGTLSQKSVSTTHQRRAEIEKKQQEKLKAQDEEREEDQRKRQEELDAELAFAEAQWKEESSRIRRSYELAMARVLRTKSTPHLYYLPSTLRAHEQEQIEQQIADANSNLQHQPNQSSADDNVSEDVREEGENQHSHAVEDRPVRNSGEDAAPQDPEGHVDSALVSEKNGTLKESHSPDIPNGVHVNDTEKAEDNEDVMVEAGEDSVIY